MATILNIDMTGSPGRLLAAADVHGAFEVFERALAGIGYDPDADVVVIIGDLVTAPGPEGPGFLQAA